MRGGKQGYRSATARKLAHDIRKAGGQIERGRQSGKLIIRGPLGTFSVQEPRNDEPHGRSTLRERIAKATGLRIGETR